jgi:uncharacterized membrane protein
MRKLFLITLMILISQNYKSQIYFKNNTEKPVFVALVHYRSWSDFKGWVSDGWFYVLPNEKKEILGYNPFGQYIYYYAQTKDATQKFEGKHSFLVHPNDSFKIVNADKDYVKEEQPEYRWCSFREIDKGTMDVLKIKYTIELNY